MPRPRPEHRLALARALAWGLLTGGWLSLGEAGTQAMPLWAGGMVPLTVWLATIGTGLALLRGRALTPRTLRAAFALGALALVLPMPSATSAVLVQALVGAVIVMAASFVVKALRRSVASRPPAPLWPAAAGALFAWAVLSTSGAGSQAAGVAAAVAAVALAALVPRRAPAVSACRAGLFDCSLPWTDRWRWQDAAAWPRQAAMLTMLPTMAMLPAMAAWCRSSAAWPPGASGLAHVAAMLLPALLLQAWLRRGGPAHGDVAAAMLMLASGGALALAPGLDGLMAASLLQASAWSLAWASMMLQPRGSDGPAPRRDGVPFTLEGPRPVVAGPALRALAPAATVLALGVALSTVGPEALRAVQAVLASMALPMLAHRFGACGERRHPAGRTT